MFGQKHNNTYCIDLSIISYYIYLCQAELYILKY
jgi:hypothetical protein